jgi:hypothetical protein
LRSFASLPDGLVPRLPAMACSGRSTSRPAAEAYVGRVGMIVLCALFLAAPLAQAGVYNSLHDALGASRTDRVTDQLPGDAVAFIVERCQLSWTTDNPIALKDGEPLGACVSPDRRYCVLTRPYQCDGCSGRYGEAALVDSTGLLWTTEGPFLADAIVSSCGNVALFRPAATPRIAPARVWLLVLTAERDTLASQTWPKQAHSPIQLGLSDVYGFSPDGQHLLFWGAAGGDSLSNLLCCFDLDSHLVRTVDVGAFCSQGVSVSTLGAELRGSWPPFFDYIGHPAPRGNWRVTWSTCNMEKSVREPSKR